MEDLIVFIGPKKAATSSIYDSIKNTSKYFVLAKETNILMQDEKKILKVLAKEKRVIDISPQYFSSFRAMFNISKLVKKGCKIKIYIGKRNSDEAFRSHLSYMSQKQEIKKSKLGQEFETLFLQNNYDLFLNYWKNLGVEIKEYQLEKTAFIETIAFELGIDDYSEKKSNLGNFQTTPLYKFFKFTAKSLRRLGLYFLVEKISKLSIVQKLAYSPRVKEKMNTLEKEIIEFNKKIKSE